MKEYTIYNPDNGQILRVLKCNPEFLEINISENQYKLSTYIRKEFKIQVFKKKGVVIR